MAEEEKIRELPAKLSFFQPDIIQDTIESSILDDHHPIGFQRDNLTDPIKFFIPGGEHWMDFDKAHFDIQGTIIGDDGSAATKDAYNTSDLTIVNNFFHSLFSAIHVNVNNSAVTFSNENYQMLSYFIGLFNYNKVVEDTQGSLILWHKDTAGHMDASGSSNNTNVGGKLRKSWITAENKLMGVMKLRSPLFWMRPYLLPFLNVDITMNRISNHDFLFIAPAASTFKFRIDSIVLRIRKAKAVGSFNESIENMMYKVGKNIKLPLRNSSVITKTYSGYGTELIEDNLFHGILPDRIIVGIVNNSAFNGSKSENPFNFQHKNITECSLRVNGMPFPTQPYPIDFSKKNYHNAYFQFLESCKSFTPFGQGCVNLSKEEYANGYTLFSFEMSSDQHGGMNHYHLFNDPANVQLYIKFAAGRADDIITLVVYYETSSRMVIDSSRQVQVFSK